MAPVKSRRIHDHVSKIPESAAWPNPTVEFIDGTEVISQIPPNPKAVLFVAHGCGGSPRNFWPRCPGCVNCVGLPEESRIIHDALNQKHAVIIIKSNAICWSYHKDGSKVKEIIRLWLQKNDLVKVKLPLVGLGASSGGYFLSLLATKVRFRGVVLMIAAGLFDRMDGIPYDYPSTLFVHMPKDINRSRKIDRHIQLLKERGIQVQEIKCMEFPLMPNLLADKIPDIDEASSSKLFKLFQDKGYIDGNGYMKNDGRVIPWRQALKENNIVLPYGSAFMHHIEEELNLAYAYHEMTSLQDDEIFEWLRFQLS